MAVPHHPRHANNLTRPTVALPLPLSPGAPFAATDGPLEHPLAPNPAELFLMEHYQNTALLAPSLKGLYIGLQRVLQGQYMLVLFVKLQAFV